MAIIDKIHLNFSSASLFKDWRIEIYLIIYKRHNILRKLDTKMKIFNNLLEIDIFSKLHTNEGCPGL